MERRTEESSKLGILDRGDIDEGKAYNMGDLHTRSINLNRLLADVEGWKREKGKGKGVRQYYRGVWGKGYVVEMEGWKREKGLRPYHIKEDS